MKFVKGQSGNPGGRPKAKAEVIELARAYSKEAIEVLAKEMKDAEQSAARIAAADKILDRAWGKPPQSVEHDGTVAVQVSIAGDDRNLL